MFQEFFPNAPGGASFRDMQLYNNLNMNVYADEFGPHYQNLLDENVYVSVMAAELDGCCSPRSIEAFMREQTFWGANWDSAPWTGTDNGFSKTWAQKSEFEIINSCSHAIFSCDHGGKIVTLSKLRRLTSSGF
jgi:hypothetical protein